MLTFKKSVLAALALTSVMSHADLALAVGGAKGKPEGARRVEIDRIAKDSRAKSGTAVRETAELSRAVETSNIARLTPDQSRALQELIADPANTDIRTQIKSIIENKDNAQLTQLNAAQLEALSNLKGMQRDMAADAISKLDPATRAEQGYLAMATTAASQAKNWAPEVRLNFEFLLAKANEKITNDRMTRGEALLAAAKDLETQRKVKVNVDDILRLCK